MKLNANSGNVYINSWDFFHRSTEEIIALFISITFVLDAFKGIIKGKSCNDTLQSRSLLCFIVKGEYEAANMHDACSMFFQGLQEKIKVLETSSSVSAIYMDMQNFDCL